MQSVRRSALLTVFSGLVAAVMCIPWAAEATVTSPGHTAPAGAPTKVHKYRTFETPSHNIRCGGSRNGHKFSIRCDISQHDWSAPGPDPCTQGDYGSAFGMNGRRGHAGFICVSDMVGGRQVLHYGNTWHMGPMTCRSKSVGLTCWNGRGHGWFLSRESYNLF